MRNLVLYSQLGLCLLLRVVGVLGAVNSRGVEPSVSWAYESSQLETVWMQNVLSWSEDDYCSHVPEFHDRTTYWLATTEQLMLTPRYRLPAEAGGGVFSMFHKVVNCGEHSHKYSTWIEPLAMSLRHPQAPCDGGKMLSRGYLLLSSIVDVQLGTCGRPAQHFLFDLGASLWASGSGGASQSDLVKSYATRGIHFDRIICWEATSHTVEEIYRDVPHDLMGKYIYYNFPVTSDLEHGGNPLNVLKRITAPSDFVSFKMDIDHAVLENDFIHQILADPQIYSRIDEFMFEHHVDFKPMGPGWGPDNNKTYTLEYSYKVFTALRQRGIRAHGWP
jgi:hypothetical protein